MWRGVPHQHDPPPGHPLVHDCYWRARLTLRDWAGYLFMIITLIFGLGLGHVNPLSPSHPLPGPLPPCPQVLLVGAHFAAHDAYVERRNADFHRICAGLFAAPPAAAPAPAAAGPPASTSHNSHGSGPGSAATARPSGEFARSSAGTGPGSGPHSSHVYGGGGGGGAHAGGYASTPESRSPTAGRPPRGGAGGGGGGGGFTAGGPTLSRFSRGFGLASRDNGSGAGAGAGGPPSAAPTEPGVEEVGSGGGGGGGAPLARGLSRQLSSESTSSVMSAASVRDWGKGRERRGEGGDEAKGERWCVLAFCGGWVGGRCGYAPDPGTLSSLSACCSGHTCLGHIEPEEVVPGATATAGTGLWRKLWLRLWLWLWLTPPPASSPAALPRPPPLPAALPRWRWRRRVRRRRGQPRPLHVWRHPLPRRLLLQRHVLRHRRPHLHSPAGAL